MDPRAQVDGFLANIGANLGMVLRLDDHGACVLVCDTGLECEIQVPPGGEQLLLSAQLTQVASDTVTGLASFALALNHNLHATRGCTLSADPDQRLYVELLRRVSELNSADFANLLGGFITTAKHLHEQIGEYLRTGGEVSTSDTQALEDVPLWQQLRV